MYIYITTFIIVIMSFIIFPIIIILLLSIPNKKFFRHLLAKSKRFYLHIQA